LGFDDVDVEDGEEDAPEPVAVDPVPVPEDADGEAEVLVVPDALAAAWNAAKVIFAVGLTAKTMPLIQ
jgi:hypothetical protein